MPADSNVDVVWLLVPAFNAAGTLGGLLSATSRHIPAKRTVVVDDGSSDATPHLAQEAGVHLLTLHPNRGKGAALTAGLDFIRRQGGGWAISMDADLQHEPDSLPAFLAAAREARYDLVVGFRRRSGSGMPWDRRFSNWSTSLLMSLLTGCRIRDAQCGFRLVRINSLDGMQFRSQRFEFEGEMLLKIALRGGSIGWTEIPTRYGGESSAIRRAADTWRFLRMVANVLLDSRKGSA